MIPPKQQSTRTWDNTSSSSSGRFRYGPKSSESSSTATITPTVSLWRSSSNTIRSTQSSWSNCFRTAPLTPQDSLGVLGPPKSSSLSRTNNRLNELERGLDMAQLRFEDDNGCNLYGRQREKEILQQECSSSGSDSRPSVVLVSGTSGIGKSALVKAACDLKHTGSCNDGASLGGILSVMGKYDFQQRAAFPYPGITQACRHLCRKLLLQKQRGAVFWTDERQHQLRESLGSSVYVLARLLPSLLDLVGLSSEKERSETDDSTTTIGGVEGAQRRFVYAMTCFLRVAASWSTVVMVLDDLQWADSGSFDLLESLMNDQKLRGLVLVCSYRSNEVDEAHLMSKWIRGLENEESKNVSLTRIQLTNLNVDAVNEMVAGALRTDAEVTHDLATIVHGKTLGNPFFVKEYLKLLQEKKVLSFSLDTFKWTWSLDEVKRNTEATENVIDTMQEKMFSLPKELSEIIPLAACLGTSFTCRTLSVVVDTFHQEMGYLMNGEQDLGADRWLEICVDQGFIVKVEENNHDNRYSWVHDKVQEAALGMIVNAAKLKIIQSRVGEILVSNLTTEEVDENIFLIANLLLDGMHDLGRVTVEKCIEMAKLHAQAGHAAMTLAAFAQATVYLKGAIRCLPQNSWQSHYAESLEIFSSAAEASYAAGSIDEALAYSNAVISQRGRHPEDKFRAYDVQIPIVFGRGDPATAQAITLSALDELGCKLPRRAKAFFVLKGLLRLKAAAKKFDLHTTTITSREMKDKAKIKAMKLLDRLCNSAYQTGSLYLPLAVLKLHQWSTKFGISELSPSAFAIVSLLLMSCKEYDGAKKYAFFALELVERGPQFERFRARTVFLTYCWVMHAFVPIGACLKAFLKAYKSGLSAGDVENGCQCIHVYLQFSFFIGKNLALLDQDWSIYAKQVKSFSLLEIYMYMSMRWQVVRNLMGHNEDPRALNGDAFSIDENPIEEMQTVAAVDAYTALIDIAFYMGDDVKGANHVLELHKRFTTKDMNPGIMHHDNLLAHSGILCFGAMRKEPNKKYLSIGKKCHAHIKEISKHGNSNFLYADRLMDAEVAALSGCEQTAKLSYERAIAFAARTGLINEQAVANERFADFMRERGDLNEATYRWNKAIELYEEWGAAVKVKEIGDKVTSLTSR